jgi:hypothetical protein
MKGKRSFSIPEQYFDTLPGRISGIIKNHKAPSASPARAKRRLPVYLYAAAAFTGLLIVGYFSMRLFFDTNPQNELSQNEVIEYIEFYTDDFDESLVEENLESAWPGPEVSDAQKDAIITYLLNEGIDEQVLLNEL